MVQHTLTAERFRPTPSKRREMERQAKRNERFRRKPVEITQQPVKKRNAYVGRVTFVWMSGPKKDQKHSVMITLQDMAKLRIKGQDLEVKPRDGDPYIWGAPKDEAPEKKEPKEEKKPPEAAAREKRFRDILRETYQDLITERGPLDAGKAMAKMFVRAHNQMTGKMAKRALAKVYGVILKTNKAGHRSFSRSVRKSASLMAKPTQTQAQYLSAAQALLTAALVLDPSSGAEVDALLKKLIKKAKEWKGARDATQYRERVGKCPKGYRYNKDKGKCQPTTPKAAPVPPPEEEKPVEEPVEETPSEVPETPEPAPPVGDGGDDISKKKLTWDPVAMEMVDEETGRRYTYDPDEESYNETSESKRRSSTDEKEAPTPKKTKPAAGEPEPEPAPAEEPKKTKKKTKRKPEPSPAAGAGDAPDDTEAEEPPTKPKKKQKPKKDVPQVFTMPPKPPKDASEEEQQAYNQEVIDVHIKWMDSYQAWKDAKPKFPAKPKADSSDEEWAAYDDAYDAASEQWDEWMRRRPRKEKS